MSIRYEPESAGSGGTSTSGDRNTTLQVLLSDYSVAREDEREFHSSIATLISVAIALLAAIIAIFYQSCDLTPKKQDCLHIAPIVYAGMPAPPLVLLAYLGILGNTATIRSFYLRAVERKLNQYVEGGELELGGATKSLPVPMFSHLVHNIVSQRHGLVRYIFLTFIFYCGLGLLFFGVTVTSLILTKSVALQIGMGLAYGTALVVFLLVLWSGSLGGRALWERLLDDLEESRMEPLVRSHHIPTELRRYLFLPRAGDLVAKAPLVILAAVMAAAASPKPRAWDWIDLIVFVLAFEYLAYQARYMVNDIRNMKEDARDPMASSRRRLPDPLTPSMLRATLFVLVLRIIGWLLAVAWLWGKGLGIPLLVAGSLIFVIAVPYEALRTRVETQTDQSNVLALTREKTGIYLTVGLGYALRALTGLWIATGVGLSLVVVIVGAVSLSSFGTMFVTMTWVTVATGFVEPRSSPTPFPSQCCAEGLIDRGHYGPLMERAGLVKQPLALTAKVIGAKEERPILWPRNRGLRTIWNRTFVLSSTGMSILGLMLSRGLVGSRPILFVSVAAGVGITSVVVCILGTSRRLWLALISCSIAVLLGALSFRLEATLPWLAPIPYAAVCLSYVFFAHSKARDLEKWSKWPELVTLWARRQFEQKLLTGLGLIFGPKAVEIWFEGRRNDVRS